MGVSPPVRCSARCLIYDIPFYINGRGGRRCYATCTATDDPSAGTEGMGRADGVALAIVHQRLPRVYIPADKKEGPAGIRNAFGAGRTCGAQPATPSRACPLRRTPTGPDRPLPAYPR